MTQLAIIGVIAAALGGFADSCSADGWDRLMTFVEKDVVVLRCSEERLVLTHQAVADSLVITRDEETDADLFTRLVRRRGSNPYRVWCATDRFWNDPRRPRKEWRNYFTSSFLQIIRPPSS